MTRKQKDANGSGNRPVLASAAVFCISAAVVGLELALMRCYSVASWHHFSYLVISTALLGLGASGTLLCFVGEKLKNRYWSWCTVLSVVFSLSVTGTFRLAQLLPLNIRYVLFDPSQVGWMLLYHFLLFLPFLVSGTLIGLSLDRFSKHLGGVYGANLAGSGSGGALIVGCMFFLPAEFLLYVVSALGFCSTVLWLPGIPVSRRSGWKPFLSLGMTAAVFLLIEFLFPLSLHVDSHKSLSRLRDWEQQSDATRLATRHGPRARLDVFRSSRLHNTLFAGLKAPSAPSPQLTILADGGKIGTVYQIDSASQAPILDHTPMSVAYRLKDRPKVLLLGETGGVNVWLALRFGAREVTVVQRNPQLINLMQGPLSNPSGRVFLQPEVNVVNADPRRYVERSTKQFDLIQFAGTEQMTASTSGTRSIHENFLLTRQGVSRCLELLSPGGLLTATRGIQTPPRDGVKLLATFAEALELTGQTPADRIGLFRNYLASTVLAWKRAPSKETVNRLATICRKQRLDLEWSPSKQTWKGRQIHHMDGPPGKPYSYFHYAARRILKGDRASFYEEWLYNIRPPTDQSPYFTNFFKWKSLPRFIEGFGRQWIQRLELGYVVLVVVVIEVILAGAFFILLPLRWLDGQQPVSGTLSTALYFLLLGLAFMMLEMVFIMEFTRFLGDPIYASAGMISVFLIFSGTGSAAGDVVDWNPRFRIAVAVCGIAVYMAGYLLLFRDFVEHLGFVSTPFRIVVSILVVAPPAFLMGWPFPSGLGLVRRGAPSLLPWAWGVNGFASVAASPLAVLMSIEWGFHIVISVACLLYLLAGCIVPALPSTGSFSEQGRSR